LHIATIADNSDWTLRRITLDIPIAGFKDFITPWLVTEKTTGRVILIDPGPACGFSSVRDSLHVLGISEVNLILLTHIHIDHAGGVGHLLSAYPDARVVVHRRGVRHLIDPTRLWSSTVATLGKDVASAYGEILPVSESQILPENVTPEGFEIVDTPGHSQHHQCYIYRGGRGGDLVFEGEAAGVYLGGGYLRPATPPRFFYDTSISSIETLNGRSRNACLMLYGHLGYTREVPEMLDAALDQMALWRETVQTITDREPENSLEALVEAAVTTLISSDPRLAGLKDLPKDIRERETYFLHNSARGFVSERLEHIL
jgi:glyoxylase-like metal-dependent hydrolase (beta-lactamase superfamily II)